MLKTQKAYPSMGYRVFLLLTSLIIIVMLSLPAQAASSEFDQGYFPSQHNLIMQIIKGRLYKWHESTDEAGNPLVYLLEPENKLLSEAEIKTLYQDSRQWLNQYERQNFSAGLTISGFTDFKSMDHYLDPVLAGQLPISREIEMQAMVDNRTAVGGTRAVTYPYFNTGFIKIDFNDDYMRGTGFLISPYVVLTNAHNVYSNELGGWFKNIEFSPAQYETVWPNIFEPFGSANPVLAETNESYIFYENNGNRDQTIKYDYAALFFDQAFSGIDTFVPLEFNYEPEQVMVIGYPGIVQDANTMGMWKAEGTLINKDTHCLYYDAYTSGGSSGSPVFSYNAQADTYRVVAVHSFASPGNFSGGPHLNELNRNNIENWLNWEPQETNNPVTSLTLNKSSLFMQNGDREALLVTIEPVEADSTGLSWSSSNRSVVRVDANGLVTATGPGKAVITVQTIDGIKSATCAVTVTNGENEPAPVTGSAGDVNGDGTVNVQDVTLVLQHVLLIEELDQISSTLADVNNDGEINVVDVTLLMQYALSLIDHF